MNPDPHDPSHSARNAFVTTHWTLVMDARDPADENVAPALAHLCGAYWPPLYAFLRRQGHSRHDAQDLVQGFFERFLSRDFLRQVDRDKGRFRSFLLASLRHYVANSRRDQSTQRRGGGHLGIALDKPGVMDRYESELGKESSPEVAFDRAWAQTVMEQATRKLRAEYEGRGKGALYEILRQWLAREAEPGAYARVAPTLSLTEGALAAAVFRLRQRFRELIRDEVAHTVQTPAEIGQEMNYLLHVLTAE